MKVLSINTYGGSLLLGAQAAGAEIVGSYEDTGFGSPIQEANFPHLDIRPQRRDWPKQDLSETVVIAHPPCSAFSVQNTSFFARGADSDAFKCTREVLQYAVDNNALAIAVESVIGALSGAWTVHQQYADRYGYNVYRILQNGCAFSAQWRERFWIVYVKQGAAPESLHLRLVPRWQNVGEVIRGYEDGPSFDTLDEKLDKMKTRFVVEAGCNDDDLDYIFKPQEPPHDGGVARALQARKFPDWTPYEVRDSFVTTFATSGMRFISPLKLCPVLLGTSWWYVNGRNLSVSGYKRLMGFPAGYIFPEKLHNKTRTFLSKGVIPAVAQWILGSIDSHLGKKHPQRCPCQSCADGPAYDVAVQPNHIGDLRFKRKDWDEREEALPALRQVEETA